MATHELESFFAIGNKSVFLDASRRDMPATENSRLLLAKTNNPTLRQLFCQQTLYFSDRLVRIAGHLKMDAFLKEWTAKAGKDNIGQNPPNAVLSVYKQG